MDLRLLIISFLFLNLYEGINYLSTIKVANILTSVMNECCITVCPCFLRDDRIKKNNLALLSEVSFQVKVTRDKTSRAVGSSL